MSARAAEFQPSRGETPTASDLLYPLVGGRELGWLVWILAVFAAGLASPSPFAV
jgi:hypothetical protein